MEMIDDVCAQGGRIFGLTHSRGISIITSFQTRLPFDVLAEWIGRVNHGEPAAAADLDG